MPSVGVVIPDLRGIAELKPLSIHNVTRFTSKGLGYIRTAVCPTGEVWFITHLSVGFNMGDVSDCLCQIEDNLNNRLAIISMWSNLVRAQTYPIYGSFWLMPGQKLSARFNVTSPSPTCWLTAMGLAFSFSG